MSLVDSPLPVLDTERIDCWENIEMALLKLDNDQFDILIRDKKIKTEVKQKKAENITKGIKVSKKEREHIPLETIEDPFILELEKMFESGNKNDVKGILSSYNNKKG